MLTNQALRGSLTLHPAARPAIKLGHSSVSRIPTAPKRTPRSRTLCPASRNDAGKLSPSASGDYKVSKRFRKGARSNVASIAAHSVQASYSSPESSKSSLGPVLVAVAFASLGALLFGLHVAIVNGLQDAVSLELGFSGNTGLRGAVCVLFVLGLKFHGCQGSLPLCRWYLRC